MGNLAYLLQIIELTEILIFILKIALTIAVMPILILTGGVFFQFFCWEIWH